MAKSKRRIDHDDIVEFYDLVTSQLAEDREAVESLYQEVRGYIAADPRALADFGETLTKLADIKLKQTGQVADLLKAFIKSLPEEDDGYDGFSPDDLSKIDEAIKKDGD